MNTRKYEIITDYVSIHEELCVIDHLISQIKIRAGRIGVKDINIKTDDLVEMAVTIKALNRQLESDLNEKYDLFLTDGSGTSGAAPSNREGVIVDTSDLKREPVAYGGKFHFDDIDEIISKKVSEYVDVIEERHKSFFER